MKKKNNFETAEKPANNIMADITKPKPKKPVSKITMTKVFRGEINGEYKVYMPGDKVTGKDAEYIKKNHPDWHEKGSDA
jgi:hypothetical protein